MLLTKKIMAPTIPRSGLRTMIYLMPRNGKKITARHIQKFGLRFGRKIMLLIMKKTMVRHTPLTI